MFLLPSVRIELLLEIAVLIEQAHAHQVEQRIARCLQVIARQHPQAARVNREAIEQSVLHREVRYLHGGIGARRQIRIQNFAGPPVQRQKAGVGRRALESGLLHAAQQHHGVVVGRLPDRRIQTAEDRAQRMVPAPHQVQAQFRQALQGRRQCRTNHQFPEWTNLEGHNQRSVIHQNSKAVAAFRGSGGESLFRARRPAFALS